jgi:hypothetical protein
MRQHIPPGQLSDLMDNLTAICELLVASRVPTPGTGLAGSPKRVR